MLNVWLLLGVMLIGLDRTLSRNARAFEIVWTVVHVNENKLPSEKVSINGIN